MEKQIIDRDSPAHPALPTAPTPGRGVGPTNVSVQVSSDSYFASTPVQASIVVKASSPGRAVAALGEAFLQAVRQLNALDAPVAKTNLADL